MTHRQGKPPRSNHLALVPAVLAMLALLAVLPSSLRLPTAEPTETLEFAPVVPQDDSVGANLSGHRIGLAGGGSLDLDADEPGDALGDPTGIPGGQGKSPSTKRCVGRPPLQTEDPISPPCVAHFSGDNFGATYHGVTREEVRVVLYLNGAFNSGRTSNGMEPRSCGQYIDLGKPPEGPEFISERMARAYQRYFNERYQTYGRFVRVVAYPSCNAATPESRRADAALNRADIKPFAVVTAYLNDYDRAMASYGVISFAVGSQPAAYYQQYPTLMWGYHPTLESRAAVFGSYLCRKIVPHPVSFSGNGDHGQARRLGLLVSTEESAKTMAELVVARVTACGGRVLLRHSYTAYGTPSGPSQEGIAAMSEFQREGVTTLMYIGGSNYSMSSSAATIGYQPEIVVADPNDGFSRNAAGSFNDPNVWSHAWTVAATPKLGDYSQEYCYLAGKEAGMERVQPEDFRDWGGCTLYNQMQQLFTAIQVAGPRLTPDTVSAGFRAIPGVPSGNPRRPACFYPEGDNTCIKDAAAAWWDPSGQPPNAGSHPPGCWRLAEEGRRYLASGWEESDANAVKRPGGDECNGW